MTDRKVSSTFLSVVEGFNMLPLGELSFNYVVEAGSEGCNCDSPSPSASQGNRENPTPLPNCRRNAPHGPFLLIHRIRFARSGCLKAGRGAKSSNSGVGSRVLRRLYFNFVDHLLNVRNLFGQFFSFNLLLRSLYSAFQNQSPVLCGKVDALLVECRVSFSGCFVAVLNGTIE